MRRAPPDRALQACADAWRAAQNQRGRASPELALAYGLAHRKAGHDFLAEGYLSMTARVATREGRSGLAAEATLEAGLLARSRGANREALRLLNGAREAFANMRGAPGAERTDQALRDVFEAMSNVSRAWIASIEERHPYTRGHSERVSAHAVALAEAWGWDAEQVGWLRVAGLLHDVGKFHVPLAILEKPGRLSDEERLAVEAHPRLGLHALRDVDLPDMVHDVVLHHHERWDGAGYPSRLAGEAIPLAARITAVADVYDALTSRRSYREAMAPEKALAILGGHSGTAFDPALVEPFHRVLAEGMTLEP